MASLLTAGMMTSRPTALAGHSAPNREMESRRLSRTARSREPRGAQMYPRLPCWPTLASSWNQIPTGLPSAGGGKDAFSNAPKFSECCHGAWVLLRMAGARLHPDQAELLQPLADDAVVQSDFETARNLLAKVRAAPTHHFVDRRGAARIFWFEIAMKPLPRKPASAVQSVASVQPC